MLVFLTVPRFYNGTLSIVFSTKVLCVIYCATFFNEHPVHNDWDWIKKKTIFAFIDFYRYCKWDLHSIALINLKTPFLTFIQSDTRKNGCPIDITCRI